MTELRQSLRGAVYICLAFGFALAISTPQSLADITPVIDGRFDVSEGYDMGWYLDYSVEGGPIAHGGELWMTQGTAGDLYIAFIQPLDLIDNSYGATRVNWPRDHKFDDLKRSDKARLIFTESQSGDIVLDVTLDYLWDDHGTYDSGLGGEGKVDQGSASYVLDAATSLDYNFNVLGHVLTKDSPAADDNYVVADPNYADWIFESIYEMHISADAFSGSSFGAMDIFEVHNSPMKVDGHKVHYETDGQVPEPTTLALISLGCIPLFLRRKRS